MFGEKFDSTGQYRAVQYRTGRTHPKWDVMNSHSTVQYSTVQYSTVQDGHTQTGMSGTVTGLHFYTVHTWLYEGTN